MSVFTQQIERVHAQLVGLSTGRKLLWGCLLAAAIAASLLLGRSSRSAGWEPVLDQPLDSSQIAQITSYLSGAGVPFRNNGSKVLVPSDRKMQVLADLLYQDLLPGNTESGFDAIAKTSIWDSSAKIDHLYTRAKEITLQNVIGRFPGVKKATVLIDPTSEQHINGSVTPSALVDIQTWGHVANAHQLAVAAANAVTGAQSNLSRDKVEVTIDGAPVGTTIDPGEAASDEMLARTQQREQHYVAKLRKELSFIPDALISVSIKLSETPGPQPTTQNADRSIATVNATPNRARDADDTVLSASVAVPRSYFIGIYRSRSGISAEPTDGVLEPVIDAELEKIRRLVRTTLAIKSNDDVTVASYCDQQPLSAPAAQTQTTPSVDTAAAPLVLLLNNRQAQVCIGLSAVLLLIVAPLLLSSRKPIASVSSQPFSTALFSDGEEPAGDDLAAEDFDASIDYSSDPIDQPAWTTAHLLEQWIDQE